MKKNQIIGGLFFGVIFIGMVFYLIRINNRLATSRQSYDETSGKLVEADQSIQSLEENLSTIQNELTETQGEVTNLDEEISILEDEKQVLSTEISNLETENEELLQDLRDTKQESSSLERQLDNLLCSSQINMDYSSILAASSRLIGYVSNMANVSHVGSTMRNTLWNNADSKVHVVTYTDREGGYYSMQFLVYMDEFGWETATFYIDGQCWVDAP